MKHILSLILILCGHLYAYSQTDIKYTTKDSLTVINLLQSCKKDGITKDKSLIYFARKLKSVPYVGQTLENRNKEQLVVNLRQLDCTTYVETVLSLYLCIKDNKTSFNDFCNYLKNIRYKNGKVSYTTRLHYFSYWIEQNEHKRIVREIVPSDTSIVRSKVYDIHYMSHNPNKYPALAHDKSLIKEISYMEKNFDGKSYKYIPKEKLKHPEKLKSFIHDGDILAIVTNKKGLDISHIGFAVWHNGNLHLLNASSIHKKVVEEKKTLYQYMMQQRSQMGIRIVRVL